LRIAVYRPSNGYWYIKGKEMKHWGHSSGNMAIQCGTRGDIPVPGDYIGDGKIRLAVFRPSNGYWYIKGPQWKHWGHSSGNIAIQCGVNGDIPVPKDFHNEGKLRIAVYRPSNGVWYIKSAEMKHWGHSRGNTATQCGIRGDIPVPFDYYGEGKMRLAVYRPANGMWYVKGQGLKNWGQSQGNQWYQCGIRGDVPMNIKYRGKH